MALLSWQAATTDSPLRRRFALFSMALCLSASMMTHYFGLLAFVPILCGEFTRSVIRKRLDAPVWIAVVVGMVPVAALLPLIRAARAYHAPYWAAPEWPKIVHFYLCVLGAGVPMLLFGAANSWSIWRGATVQRPKEPFRREWAAAFGLMASPVITMALAVSLHSAAAPRYALPAVIGFAIALSFGAYAVGDKRIAALTSICIVLCFGASWAMRDRVALFARPGEQILFHLTPAALPDSALKTGLPIVITDGSAFLELWRNGPPSVRDKIVYLADPAASRKYIHMDNTDLQLSALHQWTPIPVQSYETFLSVHPRFLLFGRTSMWEWQISKLVEDGAKLEKIGTNAYRVEAPGRPPRR
jgi:hypothetical protein